MTKQLKTIVRSRLKALITGTVEPEDKSSESEAESDDSENDADDEASGGAEIELQKRRK